METDKLIHGKCIKMIKIKWMRSENKLLSFISLRSLVTIRGNY